MARKVKGREVPTFQEFASAWLENREPELRPKTVASYRWQLRTHRLPHFAQLRFDEIGPQEVDRYKAGKLREGTTPSRPTVEPEQLPSLLEAAGHLRLILATMAGAGLRNGEACALDWPDFDAASGTLTVASAKTDAGVRRVDLPDALRRELTSHRLRAPESREGPMFPNRDGRRQSVSNVERRLKTAIRRANTRLEEIGLRPIDEAVTPHSLRRLYASLRFALGDDPVYVAAQLGHTDPGFSMKVYASAVRRRERLIGVALREFDAALEWATIGRTVIEVEVVPSATLCP